MLSEGYTRKIKREKGYVVQSLKFLNGEMWKQARLIAYLTYLANTKDPKDIWKFFPLPGDPSPEDIAKAMDKQSKNDWDDYRNLIAALKEQGVKA